MRIKVFQKYFEHTVKSGFIEVNYIKFHTATHKTLSRKEKERIRAENRV